MMTNVWATTGGAGGCRAAGVECSGMAEDDGAKPQQMMMPYELDR